MRTLQDDDDLRQATRVMFEYYPMDTVAAVSPTATAYFHREPNPMTCIMVDWQEDGNEAKAARARWFANEACEIVEGQGGTPAYGNFGLSRKVPR